MAQVKVTVDAVAAGLRAAADAEDDARATGRCGILEVTGERRWAPFLLLDDPGALEPEAIEAARRWYRRECDGWQLVDLRGASDINAHEVVYIATGGAPREG